MNTDQLKFKIAVTLINGVGNSIARNLITYLGSEEAVFAEKKQTLMKIPGIGETIATGITNQKEALQRADDEINFILKNNIQVHYFTDTTYPQRLRECQDAPLLLFTRCAADLNSLHVVSLVGTRNATDYGRSVCQGLIAGLSGVPSLLIVSGLAYGIDICAHKAALDNGIPTVGVVAHGLDRIYPGNHRSTAIRMTEQGGIVTEYLSQTNPDRQNFIQRNRIIAGMSDAVLVIESGLKGGALITASLGNDYNRDVFAVPGKVGDTWSKGCNQLIKTNKAGMIENAEDLLYVMGWHPEAKILTKGELVLFPELNEEEIKVYTILNDHISGLQVNEIARLADLPYSKISAILLSLEFKSLTKCFPGGVYSVV
ncbi:MAG: DNA-processing protein DprA [Paludibacter sp.]|jgi:DNA processing protein|nr:DNA-processing protein DprA [Paludibacter sp.]